MIEWNVGSEPPDTGRTVLLFYKRGYGYHVTGFYQGGHWHNDGSGIRRMDTPQYWCELPVPPEKD